MEVWIIFDKDHAPMSTGSHRTKMMKVIDPKVHEGAVRARLRRWEKI